MAQFETGTSGNPKGRPRGRQNTTTEGVKMLITRILKQHWTPAKIRADLEKMTPRQRQDVLTKLAAFVVPRPTEASLKFDFEAMPPEKIEKIYSLIFGTDERD